MFSRNVIVRMAGALVRASTLALHSCGGGHGGSGGSPADDGGTGGVRACSLPQRKPGALTASFNADATDDALQANIVAAGYGK